MKKHSLTIAPSILAADFGSLSTEAKRIEEAGADAIHIDIMDGHFVPNLTLGPKATAAIRRSTDLFLDVHIMVYNPFDYIERFVEAGANRITFHLEATEDVEETLNYIKKANVEAGLALNPETSPSLCLKYLNQCDLILLMTVNPGFGGQSFIHDVIGKIEDVASFVEKSKIVKGGKYADDEKLDDQYRKTPFAIQVDGGITAETAKLCVDAGANHLVAGSYLFQKEDELKKRIELLKALV